MASKVALGVLIIVSLVLLGCAWKLSQDSSIEGFAAKEYTTQDLTLNLCPITTTEIQTAKGSTDCCSGDSVDGKCNGSTFCTKSPAYPGVPSCVDAWRSYFQKKGDDFCPPTMKNYFEDILNATAPKGCSASGITEDGKQPMDMAAKQCKIYASEEDNKTKADSCYVEKMRAKIQCPVTSKMTPPAAIMKEVWSDATKLAVFTCDYPFEPYIPTQCFDRKSLEQYWDRTQPNWRTNAGYTSWLDAIACDKYLTRREEARKEGERLEAERKAREAAEAAQKAAEERWRKAMEDYKKRSDEASRLQQQLDEANRRLQQCK